MKNNVLITGGAGFIGSALAKALNQRGYPVTVFDLAAKISKCDVVDGVRYIAGDISRYEELESVADQRYSHIYHLAAQTSGLISHENPSMDTDTNVKGTLNICRLASDTPSTKLVFTSSMAVYGNSQHAISESHEMCPTSNYGVSKLSAEKYIELYNRRGMPFSIFRLFNVYGPGQDLENLKQGMVSIYLSQILATGRIDVTGSFERYRDFVYIDDVVNALLLGLEDRTNNEIYNVGSGIKTTVKDLIDVLVVSCGYQLGEIPVQNVGAIVGDQFGTYCDISKLSTLGWAPSVPLADGLPVMIADAKEVLL